MAKTISNVTTSQYVVSSGGNPLTITMTGGVEVSNTTVAIIGNLADILTLANAGSVNGSVGIDFQSSGSIANTGRITGTVGVIAHGGSQVVTNSGTIAGSGYGVQFYGGTLALLTNTAGGAIAGTGAYGVMASQAATITNAGTIIGGVDAIDFSGSFADRLIVDPGAVFTGAVQGGSGSNTLELADGTPGQAGTISGLATAFLGFGTITVDAGATWSVVDAGSLASVTTLIDDGTLTLFAGGTITAGTTLLDAGSLVNLGSIATTVTLAQGATFTNDGTITTSGYDVLATAASPVVTNAGVVTTAGDYGINLMGGGDVTNTGQVTAGIAGIRDYGAAQTVTNSGAVSGTRGVVVGDGTGGVVINMAGGLISGMGFGILSFGENTTVTNAGTIAGGDGAITFVGSHTDRLIVDPGAVFTGAVQGGSGSNTLELADGTPGQAGTIGGFATAFLGFGTITVDAGATWSVVDAGSLASVTTLIDDGTLSLFAGGTIVTGTTLLDAGSLLNLGSIAASVTVAQGATFTNDGTVKLLNNAVFAAAASPIVNNTGVINATGGYGINLKAGGTITNTGRVIAAAAGIRVYSAAQTITNSGTVSSDRGIVLGEGSLGIVTNMAGGVISASSIGVLSFEEATTVVNAGTIIGGAKAIEFAGTTSNRVILDPGAVVSGYVQGGSGSNTLELAAVTPAQTGTISGVFTQFVGFNTITVDAGASWSLVNAGSIASATDLTDSGTLYVAGSLAGDLDITGSGTLVNANGISIAGSIAVPIIFNDGAISAGQYLTGVQSLVNHGSITGGVTALAGASIANDGMISRTAANKAAISSAATSVTVTNAGTVSGWNGIGLNAGGSVDNTNVITADVSGAGVYLRNAAQILTNSGTITGGTGAFLYGGTSAVVTNLAGGVIASTYSYGVLFGENATIINAGTISGFGGYGAIGFEGGYTARVVADPGAVFRGNIEGGAGSNTLELAAGSPGQSGTISGIGTQFDGFNSLAVDAGATWVFDASDTLGAAMSIVTAGTMVFAEAAGSTIIVPAMLSGAGSIVQSGTGTLALSGTGGFIGSVMVDAGTLALAPAFAAGVTAMRFAGGGTLRLDGSAAPTGVIDGLAAGDTIDLPDLAFIAGAQATLAAGNTLVVQSGSGTFALRLDPARDLSGVSFSARQDAGTGVRVAESIACYTRGTRLRTPDGDIAVEALRRGDLVTTASGAARPVRWIGWRSYDGRFAARNLNLMPILIRAGALADDVPVRDLRVSPLHALYLDGLLIPARLLVNGISITQEKSCAEVTYFHIELDSHDILLAEGAPAESFVDCDSRAMFQNAHDFAALHPEGVGAPWQFCAPRLEEGVTLEVIRRRLAARAGLAVRHDSVPECCVDGADAGGIAGWAYDLAQPWLRAMLDVLVDGQPAARISADGDRADLAQAGKGEGRCAFTHRFATPLAARATVALRLVDGPILCSVVVTPDDTMPGPLQGCLDRCDGREVHGWARDPAAPLAAVLLEISCNAVAIGRVRADEYRADLKAAGFADGRCAFTFAMGGQVYGGETVTVRRVADGAVLAEAVVPRRLRSAS